MSTAHQTPPAEADSTAHDKTAPADCVHPACSPARITLSRRKGWRMPPNTVKVCRPGRWGNPYRIGVDGDQAECVEHFRRNWGMFEKLNHADIVKHLRGKNLACWCKQETPCHADVLLSLAND